MGSRLIEKQVIYSGKKVKLELHHLEDDETQTRHIREVVVHSGAVVVMGVLPDQRIILIRTRRYAVGQTLVELPAGTLERNEDPINCAGRELLEETGYQDRKSTRLNSSHGYISYAVFCLKKKKNVSTEPSTWRTCVDKSSASISQPIPR